MYLLLWLFFRQPHPNFINARLKFGHNWQKIISQNQSQKDSESTL